MNHLREMNFLVVVSVPLTTESWLLLRGEPRKDADDCRKMLSPPEVQASGAGLCPPLAFSESDLRVISCGITASRRRTCPLGSPLLFSELKFQVTTQWRPPWPWAPVVLRLRHG